MARTRLLLYAFNDRNGIVDNYVLFQLEQMKTQVTTIVFISQVGLRENEYSKVEGLVNDIIIRKNSGYDVDAWRECLLEYLGWDKTGKYDDLILMNDSCFGPVFPICDLFAEMDSKDVDFWGMTKRFKSIDTNQVGPYGFFPDHIQAYFMCFREQVHKSSAFQSFWEKLKPVDSEEKRLAYFETVLTKHLEDNGFSWDVFANTERDKLDSMNNQDPTIFNIDELLIEQRTPFIKRESMMGSLDVFLMKMDGSQARRCLDFIDKETDYDVSMIYNNIIRLGNTRELYELYHWNYFLPEEIVVGEKVRKKIALIIHLFYEEQFEFCHRYVKSIPDYADVYITVADARKADTIKKMFCDINCHNIEVRLVDEKGMDISALLIGARDVFLDDYDYICFIHDKMSFRGTVDRRAGEGFRDSMFNCMLKSEAYIENLINLFEKEPFLGLLAPSPPISGRYILAYGRLWLTNFEGTVEIANKLQLNSCISKSNDPIALGTTFWCRPEAIRKLIEYPWTYDDFEDNTKRREGDFLHCIERIIEYVAQDAGYYTGIVMPLKHAQFVYTVEDHKLYSSLRRIRKLEGNNKRLKSIIKKMKKSRSWRYTSWLRKK